MSNEKIIANWAATYLTYLVTFFLYNDFFVVGGDGSSIIFFSQKPYQYCGQGVSVVKIKHLTKYEVCLVMGAL